MTQPSPLSSRTDIALIFGQMLLCSFFWASAFLLMKLIGTDISPWALTALRGVMGGGLLALWVMARRQNVLPRGREWRDWLVLGILQGIIPNTLTAFALTRISAGLTSMIQASTPLIVAVLAHLLFAEERLRWQRAGGVLVGFAGMAILLGPDAFLGDGAAASGIWAMAATAVSYAIGNLYVRSIPQPQPLRLAMGQQAFSGLPTLAAVLLVSGPAAFVAVPGQALPLVALGLFATALPIVLYMTILRQAGPTLGSMNGYLVPIWTIGLAAIMLHEIVTGRQILGGAVVLAGLAIVSLTKRAAMPLAPKLAA